MAEFIDPWEDKKSSFGLGESSEEFTDPWEVEPKESTNPLVNLGVGLYKGTVYGIPEQLGKAAQFLGVGGETAKRMAKWGEEGLGKEEKGVFRQTGEMIPESIGVPIVSQVLGSAIQTIPHPAAQLAGMAIKIGGRFMTPALFGLAQAQATKETAEEKGMEPGITPYVTGGIEWAGETAANIALGRVLGPLATMGKVAKAAVGKMGATAAMKGTIGAFLKELALVQAPTEILTEMGQNYFEALAEKRAGIRPEADPGAEALSAIAPTALMTAILGPFARVAQRHVINKQASILAQPVDLQDPNAEDMIGLRMRVAEGVRDIIPDEDLKKQWADYAAWKINNNLPIDVGSPLDSLAMEIDKQMDEDPEGRKVVEPPVEEPPPEEPPIAPPEGPPVAPEGPPAAPPVVTEEPPEGPAPPVVPETPTPETPPPAPPITPAVPGEEKAPEVEKPLAPEEPPPAPPAEEKGIVGPKTVEGKAPFSPVPPPVEGKRNWYEFSDPNFPAADLTDEEQMRLLQNTGPTAEETATYEAWKKTKEVAAAGITGKETAEETETARLREEIMKRSLAKIAQEYPDMSINRVSGILRQMTGDPTQGERVMKGTEFLSELTSRLGIENKYEFLGKIVDRLGIPVHLLHREGILPGYEAFAGYLYPQDMSFAGKIAISYKGLARENDYGKGYGPYKAIEAFAHEAIHGILRNSPQWRTDKRFVKYWDEVLRYQDRAPENVKKYFQHINRYGMDELITQAFTSGPFAQWLDSIPTEGVRNPSKTLWGKLKDLVFRVLETFGVPRSKLDELNDLLDNVLGQAEEVEYGDYRKAITPERPEAPPVPPEIPPRPEVKGELPTPEAPEGWIQMQVQGITVYMSDDGDYAILVSHGTGFYELKGRIGGGQQRKIIGEFKTFKEAVNEANRLRGIKPPEAPKPPIKPPEAKPPEKPAEPPKPTIRPEEKETQYGTLQKVKTIPLSDFFMGKIESIEAEKADKNKVIEWVSEAFEIPTNEVRALESRYKYDHKAVEEAFEFAMVRKAQEAINTTKDKDTLLGRFINWYRNQPILGARTSTSTAMQQYSTPLPMAWIMNRFLGLTGKNSNLTVFEPTAGNGMLLVGANPGLVAANEKDKGTRLAHLKHLFKDGTVTSEDALSATSNPGIRELDRIVANPPFGVMDKYTAFDGYRIKKLEHKIIAMAMIAMKDNGKAALIIQGDKYNETVEDSYSSSDRTFFNWLYNNYNVTHHIGVAGELYGRQGTKFPVRLITVEGRKAVPDTGFPTYIQDEKVNTFEELDQILRRHYDTAAERGEGPAAPGRLPEKGKPGGPPVAGEDVSEVREGGERGGRPGERAGAAERTPEGEGGAYPAEPGAVPVGQRPAAPAEGMGRPGEERPGVRRPVEPQSAAEKAIEELGKLEIPDFMPFDRPEEEDYYQKTMKPFLDKTGGLVIKDLGPESVTTGDFLQKIKDVVGEKIEKMYKYLFRWMKEEFEDLRQRIRDSAIFQIAYKSVSKGPSGKVQVPLNMEYFIRKALQEIEKEKGDIDEWVKTELGYKDKDSLYKALAAEQIDAVALALKNVQDRAGIIVGDQTGVGKGRVVAAMIRYANRHGIIPVFVTDNAKLFSDMYRDLLGIDHKINPFIMNNDAKANIVDLVSGEVLLDRRKDGKGERAISGTQGVNWEAILQNPEQYMKDNGFQVIFTTYSQHRGADTKNQDRLIEGMGRGNIFLLDESHNAGGDAAGGVSNTKRRFTEFLHTADAVLYSSATFAKSPSNMDLYYRTALGDTNMQMWELIQAIKDGGNPLQEYISSALAAKGQYLRRELDFTGINFLQTPTMNNTDPTNPLYRELEDQYKKDKKSADETNQILENIIRFSGDFRRSEYRPILIQYLLTAHGAQFAGVDVHRLSAEATNFASVVHNINSQLLMSLKTQKTIEEAKAALKDDKKVVIEVTNTMGSFIDDLIKMGIYRVSEEVDFTFKAVLERALRNSLKIRATLPTGEKIHVIMTPEELRQWMPQVYAGTYMRVKNLIGNYAVSGLYGSPLDRIANELSDSTKKPVVDLSRRGYRIETREGKHYLRERTQAELDGKKAVILFNSGKSDVMIINRSGSVGISVHSAPEFEDKRVRVMLFLQPDPDINIFMQAAGRINRKGQVINPEYKYITSDLPTEIRPAVILTRKLKSLKANTTSKQIGAEQRKDIPDMMNRYGDEITRAYLNRNKQLAIRIGIIRSINDNIAADDSTTYAKISGKISILPIELQKDFYNEIESMYESYIQELTERGENELISKNYDYQARTITKSVIYQGDNTDDPFTGKTYVEKMRVRHLKRPYNSVKVKALVAENLAGKTGEQYSQDLYNEAERESQAHLREWAQTANEKYPGDLQAQQNYINQRTHLVQRELDYYRTLLNEHRIGDTYTLPIGEHSNLTVTGVLTKILWTKGHGNPVQPAKLKFVYAVPEPLQTVVYNAGQSFFREDASIRERGIPENWDVLIPEIRFDERFIVTGNLLRAFNILNKVMDRGGDKIRYEMVNYSRESGKQEFGLVIARHHEDMVEGLTPDSSHEPQSWSEAVNYLMDEDAKRDRIITSSDGVLNIQSLTEKVKGGGKTKEYVVNVPSSKQAGAKYYQDNELMALVRGGNFVRHSQRMTGFIENNENLYQFLRVLNNKHNVRFMKPLEIISAMPVDRSGGKQPWEMTAVEARRAYPTLTQEKWDDAVTAAWKDGRLAEDSAPVQSMMKAKPRDFGEIDAVINGRMAPSKELLIRHPELKAPEELLDAMPVIRDLTNKFFNNPQETVPDSYIKSTIKPFLKSQEALKNFDKYLGLPWWNAKKYPSWRKAFEIFGIERPEKRGEYMHSFAKSAEPYFKLPDKMRKAGMSAKDVTDSLDRINRTIITGDAMLGEELRALKRQAKNMPDGPARDAVMNRIFQIETLNRYTDEELRKGIKDEKGNVIKLNEDEITAYKSVRYALDRMFDTFIDHLQAMAFRNYMKQKWYHVLLQAAGMDLAKEETARVVASTLNRAALLKAIKIQPDIQKIWDRVEKAIGATPDAEKMQIAELYEKISDKLTAELTKLREILRDITGIKDEKKLMNTTREIFAAYMFTRPEIKKIKALRNTYKKQVAFFPRVREQGPYKIKVMQNVYDENGMIVKQEQIFMKMFENERDAGKIHEEIMNKYAVKGKLPEDIEILPPEHSARTPEFAFQGVSDINMQKVLDDAIEGMKIKDVYYDEQGRKVSVSENLRYMGYMAIARQFQSRGFGRHMIHRQRGAIKGYEEKALMTTLYNYMAGMSGLMTKQVAAMDFLEHMKTVPPEMFPALAKYGRNQLRNETEMDKLSNKVRSFMFTWYLGGVLRPAVVQLTQNFVTGIPAHAKYLRENKLGGAGKADRDYIKAMKDIATNNLTSLEERMEEELLSSGVTVDQYIREIFGGLGSRFTKNRAKFFEWLAIPFSNMERFNRKSAALTRFRVAYDLALKNGKNDQEAYEEAFNSAREFVYDTHYAMGKANLPMVAQGEGLGIVAKTLYTFKSFTHNYIVWMKNNLEENEWRTVLHSMAYLALFGGLMGLPFFKDLFEWIEKEFGISLTKSLRKTLNSAGGKTLETFGMNGLPAMLGMNMSGSLAIGIPFLGEDSLQTIGGVYEGQAQKIRRAGESIIRGDKYRFASNIMPEFMRGPTMAMQESELGKKIFGTPGYTTTVTGRPVYAESGKALAMGPGEAIAKAAGFSPTEFMREKEKSQTVKRLESWATEKKQDAAERYRIARVQKEPDALKNLMKDVQAINKGIRERNLQALVPLASVQRIIQSSREVKNLKQRREQAFKRAEL